MKQHGFPILTNEYPNIFRRVNRSQMTIRIYLAWKKTKNIKTNEYICPNIFEYIEISEYVSHTVPGFSF